MKRQSLYIGGALLATTALSTSVQAGTIVDLIADGGVPGTTLATASLSAQVFGPAEANTVKLGGLDDLAAFTINFDNSLTTTFDFEIESTNSDFNTGFAIGVFEEGAGRMHTMLTKPDGFEGCTVQVLTERILVEDCMPGEGNTIDAVTASGVIFDEANGLATAGTSIVLSGIVRGQSNNTFELISNGTLVTSANAAKTTITAGAAAIISNTATPPFSDLNSATRLTLATVDIAKNDVVGIDLSTKVLEADLAASAEFTITHGVLTDAATTSVEIVSDAAPTQSAVPSVFNGNVASFNIDGMNVVNKFDVEVNFDGTTAISAWSAGTLDVTFSPGTSTESAIPSASGSMAALSRGGFSTELNTLQSSAGNGATLFQSFVRVVNNGAVAGTAILSVRDDSDGSLYGHFTTATIEPNATVQVGMPAIEADLGITGAGQYKIGISGSIAGYAQHVMFNSVNNTFVDLSGFRNESP